MILTVLAIAFGVALAPVVLWFLAAGVYVVLSLIIGVH